MWMWKLMRQMVFTFRFGSCRRTVASSVLNLPGYGTSVFGGEEGSQCEFAEMVWADYAGRRDRVSDDVSLRKWLEEDPVKPQYIFF